MNLEKWEQLKKQGSNHYKTCSTEPVDLYASGNMFHDFALSSIIKYAFRSRRDERLEANKLIDNLNKIIDYAEKLKAYLGEE